MKDKKSKRLILHFALSFCILIFTFCIFSEADAASLYFSPSSGSYTVGTAFSTSIYVSSADQAMNAASGIISFPPDKLEVISLSKTGSIFNLWVQEPVFSNSAGTVNFEGIVLNPGFTGSAGKIITLNFRTKKEGSAFLNFSSGSVLANDGKGTDILTSMGSANYFLQTTTITSPIEEVEETTPPATLGVPSAPQISSPTHPDPKKWYSNNNPEFNWKLPSDVTKVSYAIDQNPTTNPKFVAETLIDKVSFTDLEDGIWYFHINFRNQYDWGKLTHRKVLIDTQPPEPFQVTIDNENDHTNSTPIFLFETTDSLSGMDYYEVILNNQTQGTVSNASLKDNPYRPLPLPPGKYSLEVKAFDKAKNYVLSQAGSEILPIETPKITKFPKRLDLDEPLNMEGESLPEVEILVFIQQKGREAIIEEKTEADKEGKWVFLSSKPLAEGDWQAWVQARSKRGALSLPSSKINFSVGLPPILEFGTIAIGYLTIMGTLLVLIAVLILVIFYTWYRVSLWRKKLRAETKEVMQAVLSAFKALREEVQEQIEYLDGKPGLSSGEKKVRDKLKEAMDISEQFIGKELKDIEKELE